MSRRQPVADSDLAARVIDLLSNREGMNHADLMLKTKAESAELSEVLRALKLRGTIKARRVMCTPFYTLAGPAAPKNPNVAPAPTFRPPMPMSARTLASIATAAAARR